MFTAQEAGWDHCIPSTGPFLKDGSIDNVKNGLQNKVLLKLLDYYRFYGFTTSKNHDNTLSCSN